MEATSPGGTWVDPRQDVERLSVAFEGMHLLEYDYLGGMGSRGYGKVEFENIRIILRTGLNYFTQATLIAEVPNVRELLNQKDGILEEIRAKLGL